MPLDWRRIERVIRQIHSYCTTSLLSLLWRKVYVNVCVTVLSLTLLVKPWNSFTVMLYVSWIQTSQGVPAEGNDAWAQIKSLHLSPFFFSLSLSLFLFLFLSLSYLSSSLSLFHTQNLYESIKSEPFKIPEDDGNDLTHTFFNPDREGWLLKLGECRPRPPGSQSHQRVGIVIKYRAVSTITCFHPKWPTVKSDLGHWDMGH